MEVILIIVLIVVAILWQSSRTKSQRNRPNTSRIQPAQSNNKPVETAQKKVHPNDMRVPENQLRVIRENEFGPRKPINPEAFKKVYRPVERYLQQNQPGFRMFAEVGMGGFIQTTQKGMSYRQRQFLYAAYGSKRIDFLVIDPLGRPALAIEYQGTGHAMRDDTVERDQVKRAILFAAGIRHIEVHQMTEPAELIADVTTQIEGHKSKSKQST